MVELQRRLLVGCAKVVGNKMNDHILENFAEYVFVSTFVLKCVALSLFLIKGAVSFIPIGNNVQSY